MKLDVGEEFVFELREVFNPIALITSEGNKVVICMRDDTLEFNVVGFDLWQKIDMDTGRAYVMKESDRDPTPGRHFDHTCPWCGYSDIKIWDWGRKFRCPSCDASGSYKQAVTQQGKGEPEDKWSGD